MLNLVFRVLCSLKISSGSYDSPYLFIKKFHIGYIHPFSGCVQGVRATLPLKSCRHCLCLCSPIGISRLTSTSSSGWEPTTSTPSSVRRPSSTSKGPVSHSKRPLGLRSRNVLCRGLIVVCVANPVRKHSTFWIVFHFTWSLW